MNRRDFLKASAALVASSQLPATAVGVDGGIDVATLRRMAWELNLNAALVNSGWYCVVHPDQYDDILKIHARGSWDDSWRQYRIARRDGRLPEMDCRAVFAMFRTDAPPLYQPPKTIAPEIGQWSGFRFIESDRVTG